MMRNLPNTYRSEVGLTLTLAAPIVVTQLAHISLSFVDTVMVGRLGPEALAGVALGNTVFFNTQIFCMGILMAVGPMVSQAFGAKDDDAIGRSVRQGLWMTLTLSVFAFAIVFNGDKILALLGQTDKNVATAKGYLRAISWGVLPFLGFISLRSFLEAVSRPRIVTVIALTGVVVNIFMNYVLMFGKWGFPEMGLIGTGWASSAVFTFNFLVLLGYVAWQRDFRPYRIFSRLGKPDSHYFKELFRIGWPIGASLGVEMSLFMLTIIMMGWLGTTQLAAHQIAVQCAAFTFMVPLGIGMASSVRVGQEVGKKDLHGASVAGFTGMGLSSVFMSGTALLFWLTPLAIVSLYLALDEPQNLPVIKMAVELLAIAAIFQIVDGVQVAAMGALRGMKDTRIPMLLSVISYWGVGLVTGYVLAFPLNMEEKGLWIGLVAGLATAAVLLTRRFYRLSHFGTPGDLD
ncbi:MAG: MATE family efflux transporter [Bacteroidetes Order II. Incertae sedis bacterium]|nr:MATE family efflux transporter [Bacteroidetes Order II. bacterium]MBT4051790.1 MATE family efflux transporter [Bacteroidetes Order II. bacterium]MBT4601647.1 MATE family efflux transporter [Bacteroidetes Order II. bacterium]MBT5249446.1 MATE family efflux transporter [Bacteroidetes Order II. bacterium]MBT6201487.1 MATE family efflux transporter [Bacteroidetes Order II. bacterium]